MDEKNLFGQIKFWRTFMIDFLKESNEKLLYQTPDGFSNNILWNAGHVLVTYDEYLSTLNAGKKQLGKVYYNSFFTGTSPADWTEDLPPVQTIIQNLEVQPDEMRKRFASRLEEELPQPLPLENTTEELFCFLIAHECYHLGTMKSISRIIKSE
jgi:uncharacterized damage-inducible protein DinB